jgi:hypothetical protein
LSIDAKEKRIESTALEDTRETYGRQPFIMANLNKLATENGLNMK